MFGSTGLEVCNLHWLILISILYPMKTAYNLHKIVYYIFTLIIKIAFT